MIGKRSKHGEPGGGFYAVVCGVWVAGESAEIALINPFGRELRRFETDMRSVRSLTVEEDGCCSQTARADSSA